MRLSPATIHNATAQKKTVCSFDGRGLYLEIAPSASRWWRFKYPTAAHGAPGFLASAARRRELGEFLRSRREGLSPEQFGPRIMDKRRAQGLRRQDVARRAGIGASWYASLEQGRVENLTHATLWAVAWTTVMVLRRGFGGSGGEYADTQQCASPDYYGSGRESARDLAAAIRFLSNLPQVDRTRIISVGVSAGGFGRFWLGGAP